MVTLHALGVHFLVEAASLYGKDTDAIRAGNLGEGLEERKPENTRLRKGLEKEEDVGPLVTVPGYLV